MSKQEIFYTSPNGAGGDIIPFYDNGEYRLFFLGKGWTCVSTKDHLHFHDECIVQRKGWRRQDGTAADNQTEV